jgi:hypothetical protein
MSRMNWARAGKDKRPKLALVDEKDYRDRDAAAKFIERTEERMAKIGRGYTVKDGKIVPREPGAKSVSARIRERTSKRTRCVSKAKAASAKAQRP